MFKILYFIVKDASEKSSMQVPLNSFGYSLETIGGILKILFCEIFQALSFPFAISNVVISSYILYPLI